MKDCIIFTATIGVDSSQAMINFIRAERGPSETFRLHMMIRNILSSSPHRVTVMIKPERLALECK